MNGVVNVYKEKGFTSHDVTAILRGVLHASKIGHTGTLDPDATGVLPVCVGKATKAAELIMGRDKEYIAELVFGCETDTQDAGGAVTESTDYVFDEATARDAILSFQGGYDQIPPMYSAVKMKGVKLYEMAREGLSVEREPRHVEIPAIEILSLDEKGARIRVACSKGTYIRTLCEDIGRRTGYLAHMRELCRTACGPYRVEGALTIAEIKARMAAGDESFLVTLEELFADCFSFTVPEEDDLYLLNGNCLTYADPALPREIGARIRVHTSDGAFIGLYRVTELLDGAVRMRTERIFA